MGLLFELAAECEDRESAEQFARHFDGCRIVIDGGFASTLGAGVACHDDAWWASVCPSGLGMSGTESAADAARRTELGYGLYDQLRTSPPFRFALVGLEVECFRDYEELLDPDELHHSGLVIERGLWVAAGLPDHMEEFRPGYLWNKYEGERFVDS